MLSWQRGRHSLKFGGSYRRYIWPMWGFFQNRGYYQFTNGFTTQTATNDGTRFGTRQLSARSAGREAAPGRHPADESSAMVCGRLRAGQLAGHSHDHHSELGLRYEYMNPSGRH